MKDRLVSTSKFLSLVLLHKPEIIGMPLTILFHGTVERFLASIRQQGLRKGPRHHVHLSTETEAALNVGQRYGKPVVLSIASEQMNKDGHLFFRSTNGVWITECVPVEYIEFPAPTRGSR